ncbi:O-acetyl-ADP-ribose deacetylase 1 [Vanrija pseudolonga]|uniref:ADP-ribose 1''-phosphate phosphatase n=1 Tax=Vanrija pseudolonga TaxID=143232 RepID=A0AAF0YKH9_9TREE|nr:O-acetyl-ADP-ribose deacetylase 1 [Vanrija pseudolonga]
MPVTYHTGDLFTSTAKHLAHGVNTTGVMGKGIAVGFKRAYPAMFPLYKAACKSGELLPGGVQAYHDDKTNTAVYNVATQDRPGPHARVEWVHSGLESVFETVAAEGGVLAIPRLGAGIGGLSWEEQVRPIVVELAAKHNIDVEVWSLE